MRNYFNIRYEFDREEVHRQIERQVQSARPDYICVADGVILDHVNRDDNYREVVNGGMFCICDSSYVPLYIRVLHGEKLHNYTGSEIFRDIVASGRYRMAFLGANRRILDALRGKMRLLNPAVDHMLFYELPFAGVDEFDYPGIAAMLEADGAEIVWVALGAPKQEFFMSRLKPHLTRGVMIAVGAAFKFYSGEGERRAPEWMVNHHLEFMYRIYSEPGKQLRRCGNIIMTLPRILLGEALKSK